RGCGSRTASPRTRHRGRRSGRRLPASGQLPASARPRQRPPGQLPPLPQGTGRKPADRARLGPPDGGARCRPRSRWRAKEPRRRQWPDRERTGQLDHGLQRLGHRPYRIAGPMALTPGHSVFYALVTAASPLTSALGVLRRLTCLLQPVLLALLHPSVPGQEAGFLQARAAVRVDEDQCPGDPQPQRAGLAGDTAAGDPGDHVELVISTERDEWLTDELLMELVREVLVQRPVVDLPLPGARQDTDPGNRLLAAAGAQGLPRHDRLAPPGAGRPARRDIARLGGVFRHVLPGAVFGLGACSRCGNLRVSGLSHGVFLVLPCRLWLLR